MIQDLLFAIDEYARLNITKRELYRILGKYPDFYYKMRSRVHAAEELRARVVKDRNLEVLYITGASGSGKTTAAKYFAETKLHFDAFVTGSGDDILDGYDKEPAIILDDYRGNTMQFSELLKMLDNHTNSSVRSRYNNKDLSSCRLIIITSVKTPSELYKKIVEAGDNEPIEQLYRRLKHHYYKIDADGTIAEWSLTTEKSERTGATLGNVATIYADLGIVPGKTNDNSLFDQFKVADNRSKLDLIKAEGTAKDVDADLFNL